MLGYWIVMGLLTFFFGLAMFHAAAKDYEEGRRASDKKAAKFFWFFMWSFPLGGIVLPAVLIAAIGWGIVEVVKAIFRSGHYTLVFKDGK